MRLFHLHAPEQPWSEVAPGLILGRRPTSLDAAAFRTLGVTAILDLCAELPATAARTGREVYLSLPVLDYDSPTAEQLDEAVRWIEQHRHIGPVYIHCALGRSRSATVVAAWKIATGAPDDLDTLEQGIRTDHPPVNLMPRQRLLLEEWRRRRIGSA
jgi:protein-tyrosine phosphatase